MLPKPVAECLKQNETVDAEQFEECTILQNDIVGFTRISANCSPLQVTQMLNILFSCFDSRIALYDVYKVETIGDGYMVASGMYLGLLLSRIFFLALEYFEDRKGIIRTYKVETISDGYMVASGVYLGLLLSRIFLLT